MQARQGGATKATATANLKKYLEYRTARSKFPTGLKWMSKIVKKRGFDF
jgi:hypothetical protein